jgi:GNAT superfamily N-acetyltransferase
VSALRIVAYEPARRQQLNNLMSEVWGKPMRSDEFEWWFERNPAGPSLISLAEDDGRLVGVACMSPYRLRIDGGEQTALVPLHVATHPDYRGRGVFTLAEQRNEAEAAQRAPIAITFPNEASRRVFAARLGWVDLPHPRVWARLALRSRIPAGIERVRSFGPEADELWARLAPRFGNALVRDSSYLNWRFADSPRPYTCLASEGGIVVVGRRSVGRARVAYVADLVAEQGRAVRRLLRAALATAEARFLLAAPPPGGRADLVRSGFVPTQKRILVMGKSLRAGARLPSQWTFALGDGDSY